MLQFPIMLFRLVNLLTVNVKCKFHGSCCTILLVAVVDDLEGT